MSLKDLPQIGQNFSARTNIGGHMSLHTKLVHASHQGGTLNVLDEGSISKITDKFDNPLIKRAVKYQGGLSDYQAKAIKHKLTSDHLKDPHNFSAYKLKVAKQVVDRYKKSADVKPAETPSALHLARPQLADTISPPHRVSASPLGRQSNNLSGIGGRNPMPTTRPSRPSPMRLVI
ncbi:MAG: hypothetical protein A3J93_00915 [Candidatus Magasanikbacteria bacterium RIFOXYC2_FULL_42_28]|uniref:Uncharacterized protein n=1 Tax=Candidatus Magasanikbacteria bacterium RIFOXYC2_FULL_42_28 TaxID=1798704 RepID=A0A1F6NXU2_9BACT|nr:MAG: hypothetical protein A3J93_00915 [Candidatus Magasanikbacteria bacterium RIFOXYC2_FULL_42_28]